MKILYITTIGGTLGFFSSIIQRLIQEGNEVDLACQPYHVPVEYTNIKCKVFPISCSRSPINKGNIKAIKEIKK